MNKIQKIASITAIAAFAVVMLAGPVSMSVSPNIAHADWDDHWWHHHHHHHHHHHDWDDWHHHHHHHDWDDWW